MIRPLVVIGIDDQTKTMTVQGPDGPNSKPQIIAILADAIKVIAASEVSHVLTPGKRFQ
jgi:hypothetical protein